LYRSPSDVPIGLVYVRELSRLANLKKISINIDDNDDNDDHTNNIIVNGINTGINNGFGTSIYINRNDSIETTITG
jgi:hypothetical protein